jgi:hypothetical protein
MTREYLQLCRILKEVLRRVDAIDDRLFEMSQMLTAMQQRAVTINLEGVIQENGTSSESSDESESDGVQSAPF